jgi:hypothetical protein
MRSKCCSYGRTTNDAWNSQSTRSLQAARSHGRWTSMNRMLGTLVTALILCVGDAELVFADAIQTPIHSQDQAPAVEQSATTTSLPNTELEAAIRATAPDYRADVVGAEGNIGKARYAIARTDLNGDGKDEVFVYLMGPYFCGTGGCKLLLFSQGADGYSLLASIPISDPPVIVAQTQHEGYADFWRMQSGGGAPAQYVRHTYKGGKYVEASRTPIATKPAGQVVLGEDTDFTHGKVLEPSQ